MSLLFEKLSVAQVLILFYSLAILIGTGLLMLPISTTSGHWTPVFDAFFMSTSTVTVTGVTILNTSTYWSYFGKTVLLLLMEIGGLGIMTFWMILYQTIGGLPNLKQRLVISESLSLSAGESPLTRVGEIIKFAFAVQLIGAVLLAFAFLPEYGLAEGLYFSVFHSVSAFTNGGLDLFSNSLADFHTNPYVLVVMMLLIITGGLGFIVWDDLIHYPKRRKLRVYTKVVLITTGILWILGTGLFWIAERNTPTFNHLSLSNQFFNYLLLSVTTRSSGFTNVDFAHLSTASILLTNLLIFIGASSGSTGGGIKVSTLAIIFITVIRSFQGRKPVVFKRAIALSTIKRAFVIFTLGILLVVAGSFALSVTEQLPEGIGMGYIVTEVVSALGSTGISMGITSYLSTPGKWIIILLMLIGRVGVMTFMWSLVGEKREERINYPEKDFLVG